MNFAKDFKTLKNKIEIKERSNKFEALLNFFSNFSKGGNNRTVIGEITESDNTVINTDVESSTTETTSSLETSSISSPSSLSSNLKIVMKPILVNNTPLFDEVDLPEKSAYDGTKNVIFSYVAEKKYEKCLKNGCLFTHPPVFYKKIYKLHKYIDPMDCNQKTFHPIKNNHYRMFKFSSLKKFWDN